MTPNITLLAAMNNLCMFRYELAFVVGIKRYRWHQIQSDAVRRIKECTLLTALGSFPVKKVAMSFGFCRRNIFILSKFTAN
jgi:hypothetical protein